MILPVSFWTKFCRAPARPNNLYQNRFINYSCFVCKSQLCRFAGDRLVEGFPASLTLPRETQRCSFYNQKLPLGKDPGQNGHTPKRPHPKRPQHFWLPKRPQPKRPHCIGQNGHIGRITTKTVKLHLVKTATKGGSLPKRPHCIWSKRPQREDHYQNGHTAFGQNGRTGKTTTKTATLHLVKTAAQEGGSLD